MNIQRFHAPTARQALSKAKLAFGEGTLILSNRPTANGVEVLATGEDSLAELDRDTPRRSTSSASAAPLADPNSPVLDDTTQLAMSTLSFQDYVRERMLRRRHEALAGTGAAAKSAPAEPPAAQLTSAAVSKISSSAKPSQAPAALPQGIADELHTMKALIEERFNTLTWLGQARQNPVQSNLMLSLIRAGYSPALARTLLEHLPAGLSVPGAQRWVSDILTRNLKTDASVAPLHEQGGAFALIGATGVGKTTTAAKLAGLCAKAYGASSVGLVTLDTYRVGAHEQLRSYGRLLGVVAHLAHDRAALQDLLGLLSNKKMILIDSTGIAPNDPRRKDMLEVLKLPEVNRLLVLNAGAHGDTLDEVVNAFKEPGGAAQVVLSKLDEAVKIAPALDACIRHQLTLRGVTMGQKVPEDFDRADGNGLIKRSMQVPDKSAFDPSSNDLAYFFAQSAPLAAQQFHA